MTASVPTVLHISDLHICAEAQLRSLQRVTDAFESTTGVHLDIHVGNAETLDSLRTFINDVDPDALVVSGDITTFGDRESFKAAGDWLSRCLKRANGDERPCVIVPGNHDILAAQARPMATLLDHMPWYAKWPLRFYTRRLLTLWRAMDSAHASADFEPFRYFNNFANTYKLSTQPVRLPLRHGAIAVLAPFSSINDEPLWMNLGVVRNAARLRLDREIREACDTTRGVLKIVIMHHNPGGSPDHREVPLKHAYNAMPDGPYFLRWLQLHGIDLVLHGHEHLPGRLLYDYTLADDGHAYCLGAPSSSMADRGGCLLLQLEDINHATAQEFTTQRAEFVKGSKHELCFERHTPTDRTTRSTRLELKRFSVGTADRRLYEESASQLIVPGSLVYISGRSLDWVESKPKQWSDVIAALQHPSTCVRIMLNDPELLRELGRRPQGEGDRRDIWGEQEDLNDLADAAERTLAVFHRSLQDCLSDEQQSRVDVRVSHTILPFAATVSDPWKPWGRMFVRLLEIGVFREIESPVLRLKCRGDDLLYGYYVRYMKALLVRAKVVGGKWASDNGDLDGSS